MRLIDADTLIESMAIENAVKWGNKDGYQRDHSYSTLMRYEIKNEIDAQPTIPSVPLDKLCKLLAEMYHCPSSGWPSSGHACHPSCPDESFEKLCGTDCENYSDAERWKAFLTKWMEGLNGTD